MGNSGKYLAVNLAAVWDVMFPLKSIDAYQDKLKGAYSVFTTAKALVCLLGCPGVYCSLYVGDEQP